jgi:predicted DNA-binding WGR domain protein
MLRRDLVRPRDGDRWTVEYIGNCLNEHHNGRSTVRGGYYLGNRPIEVEFRRWVNGKLRRGYKETEPSLSRRVFFHYPTKTYPDKFWMIELDGDAHVVHFNQMPDRVSCHNSFYGLRQERAKRFATPGAARASYDKLIAAKQREGYKELAPRDTPYSTPEASAARSAKPPARSRAVLGKSSGRRARR